MILSFGSEYWDNLICHPILKTLKNKFMIYFLLIYLSYIYYLVVYMIEGGE